MVGLGTVMAPVGMSFSLLMCYSECILRFKVSGSQSSAILDLVLSSIGHVLNGFDSFKSCALPSPCPISHSEILLP